MERVSRKTASRQHRIIWSTVDRILLTGLSTAIVVTLIGCGAGTGEQPPGQARGGGGEGTQTTGSDSVKQPVQGNRVVVSRSIDFGQVNDRPYGVFEDKKEMAAFTKAVRTARRMEGILDVDFPNYDVVIDQNGKRKEIHLWLHPGSSQGMFTYVNDTGTGYTITEQSTKELIEMIWGIQYDAEQAAANGDVVAELSGGVRNAEKWRTFVSNLENGRQDAVQVVHYTIEGGPIFRNLVFNGDSLRLRYDTTHDAFGTPLYRTVHCDGIQAEETDQGTVYMLKGCGDKETWFELVLPGE